MKATAAALNWKNEFYRKVNAKIGRLQQESEEIDSLRQAVNSLKNFRKQVLTEKCD